MKNSEIAQSGKSNICNIFFKTMQQLQWKYARICVIMLQKGRNGIRFLKPDRAVLARMSKAGMNEKTGATIRTNERTIHEKKAEND